MANKSSIYSLYSASGLYPGLPRVIYICVHCLGFKTCPWFFFLDPLNMMVWMNIFPD